MVTVIMNVIAGKDARGHQQAKVAIIFNVLAIVVTAVIVTVTLLRVL